MRKCLQLRKSAGTQGFGAETLLLDALADSGRGTILSEGVRARSGKIERARERSGERTGCVILIAGMHLQQSGARQSVAHST